MDLFCDVLDAVLTRFGWLVEMSSVILVIVYFRTPFTIQRLCELVTDPTKHYKKADKFMRGVEKVSYAANKCCDFNLHRCRNCKLEPQSFGLSHQIFKLKP